MGVGTRAAEGMLNFSRSPAERMEVIRLNYRIGDVATAVLDAVIQGSEYGESIAEVIGELDGKVQLFRGVRYVGIDWIQCNPENLVVCYRGCRNGSENGYVVTRPHGGRDFGSICVPITSDRRVVVIERARYAPEVDRAFLEFPNGRLKGKVGDGSRETFTQCAVREAQESAGVMLTNESRFVDLGWHYPNPENQAQRLQIIAITDVRAKDRWMPSSKVSVLSRHVATYGEIKKWGVLGGRVIRSASLNEALLLTAEARLIDI